ncbi:outer membrane protein assembly factor BamB family protein [Streptomyces sp. 3213.3]|uniref:outer membrane protein assembly factor BamB family protein n=1 Tax=Streptomyces sp. 3213.3 TaxID=1855348 RepID=UPI000B8087DB|nr:PQQ-binding-like beta-propeller repeat protein [Streptomyces sp. 3213.3]
MSARLLWQSGRENGTPGAPLGTWAVDGTLALARPDGVRAYGLTTGEPLWSWQPPGDGDQVIAHVSRDMVDGVIVVLHHGDWPEDDVRRNDGPEDDGHTDDHHGDRRRTDDGHGHGHGHGDNGHTDREQEDDRRRDAGPEDNVRTNDGPEDDGHTNDHHGDDPRTDDGHGHGHGDNGHTDREQEDDRRTDAGPEDNMRTNDGHARVGHVRLTGLDLRTGAAVCTREQRADELGAVGADTPEVALGGGRVAVATARGRDEGPETTVRVLDARTGALHWERPLPEGRRDALVLTAGPVVVSTAGPEDSASPHTRLRLRLHMVGEDSEQAIELPQLYEAFGAHPVIVGDTLAVELVPPQPYDTEHMGSTLRAVSAATGEFRWSWSSTYGRTIFPLAHRGALLVLNGYGDRATVLDPADGRVVAERSLPGHSYQARLVASGDCLAVVCTAPRTTTRVRVFRWK